MKKPVIKIRPVLFLLFWVAATAGMMVLLGAAILKQQEKNFRSVQVHIDDDQGMDFINTGEVMQLLKDNQLNLQKASPLGEINFPGLENMIEQNPFVDRAEIFADATGTIRINVTQRHPILRVINSAGVSYYLDDHCRVMPLSANFTARVPVATEAGFSAGTTSRKIDSVTDQKLFVIASCISKDPFLSAMTEQIVVDDTNRFELIPSIGNTSILLGDDDQLDQKFSKLKTFYTGGLNHTGWQDYQSIDLRFENEVYCTRRGAGTNPATGLNNNH